MPTLLLINGFRFFFYSNENNEPAHLHISKGSASGKVWLEPIVQQAYMYHFSPAEEKFCMQVVAEHADEFKKKWHEYFGQ